MPLSFHQKRRGNRERIGASWQLSFECNSLIRMGHYSTCVHNLFSTHSRGAVAGSNTPEATDRCVVLKEEVKDLEDYEKLIDQHKNVRIP